MDSQRHFFIIVFVIVSFVLWQSWDFEHHQELNTNHIASSPNPKMHMDGYGTINSSFNKEYVATNFNRIITVKTDVFLIKINMYGGDIEEAYLVKYLESLESKVPFHLLNKSTDFKFQAQIGLDNLYLPDNPNTNNRILYADSFNENDYVLQKNQNEMEVILMHHSNIGIVYKKRYVFRRNDYSIDVYHTVNNRSVYPFHIQLYGNLIQSVHASKAHDKNRNEDNFPLYSYTGSAFSTEKEKYKKYSFKDIKRTNLNVHTFMGWIAMLQKYFVVAWLPIIPKNNTFYTSYIDDDNVLIGFKSDPIFVPVNKKVELQSTLWIGPKIQETMRLIAPNLDLVIDYGWLWFISQPLFKLLQFIHNYIDNWGISIILITLIIRLAMYPLTKAQYASIAKIRMLQPKLMSIQEECKDDKYQYHQKTIELYKSEKVNPLGGCLPILIQMPIFLALYYMLSGSVELRHAKFVLWINDLSSQDPYYILPIMMGITMFFVQKLSPTTVTDPIQKKVMTIMLMIFTIFFLWFPSGLVLYYIVSNIITIIQQQIIYHEFSKKGLYN